MFIKAPRFPFDTLERVMGIGASPFGRSRPPALLPLLLFVAAFPRFARRKATFDSLLTLCPSTRSHIVEQGLACSGHGEQGRLRRPRRTMERVMGIEPTLRAWEARVLPLNYTRT